jgi:hypothetical protein
MPGHKVAFSLLNCTFAASNRNTDRQYVLFNLCTPFFAFLITTEDSLYAK